MYRMSMVLFFAIAHLPMAGFHVEKSAQKTLIIDCIAALTGFSSGSERGYTLECDVEID